MFLLGTQKLHPFSFPFLLFLGKNKKLHQDDSAAMEIKKSNTSDTDWGSQNNF